LLCERDSMHERAHEEQQQQRQPNDLTMIADPALGSTHGSSLKSNECPLPERVGWRDEGVVAERLTSSSQSPLEN
jgi:hypothetical protein